MDLVILFSFYQLLEMVGSERKPFNPSDLKAADFARILLRSETEAGCKVAIGKILNWQQKSNLSRSR